MCWSRRNHWQRIALVMLAIVGISFTFAGCGPTAGQPTAGQKKSPPAAAPAATDHAAGRQATRAAADLREAKADDRFETSGKKVASPGTANKAAPRRPRVGLGHAQQPTGPRTFADLLNGDSADPKAVAEMPAAISRPAAQDDAQPEMSIDDTKAAVAGIRKLTGKHLTLYTDVLPGPDVDDLTDAFDRAVPQWCRYFELDPARAADWQITGFLMNNRTRFVGAGMLPADLPPFPNGDQRGKYLWLYDQPEGYYRRHLLLHEGTHAFMSQILGAMGPPWYAEGMAEMLGTHRWQDGVLTLGYVPHDKSETPGWGRVKIIKDEIAAGRGMMPAAILDYGPQAHQQNEPYGWCWGLATFLDSHPRYQDRFRQLRHTVGDPDLTARFKQQLQADWPDLNEEWQLFVMNLEYGYDVGRAALVRKTAQPLPAEGTTAAIAADRGWQSAGIRLETGSKYRLEASGRYQVGKTSDVWWCEPGGVTLHYYQGRPLGLLLAAVRDDTQPLKGLTPLANPEPVGLETTLTVPEAGTLYLRINESAAQLSDNAGQIEVRIRRQGS